MHVDAFLKKVNNESYHVVLDPAIELISLHDHLIFTGIGTSGTLGTYGARYFLIYSLMPTRLLIHLFLYRHVD